ncbi:hypothetical protein ElyMa_006137600 [Elysia marginata]|uniref:Uncharacterized protein n=1 Tax=Elysia marginata TaxID=1093978 RepID=A0AAV4GVK3_9GAST|nr:hypothetical protein ElyMa_006137600 [Elysia marginata]
MIMHIKMSELYEKLKLIKSESTEIERFLNLKLEGSSNAAVIVYKVKISIFQIYRRVMEYRFVLLSIEMYITK